MKVISTDKAPAALGPYSQAVQVGNLLLASGQIAIDPSTGELVEGLENQVHQICKNIQAVLAEAGCTIADVVKTTVFITNINDFAKVNEIYGSYFQNPYPARSCVEVSNLPKGALLEIEVIAQISEA